MICVAAVGLALAAYGRYLEPARPGVTSPRGFYGFYDQGSYLDMARLFARGRIPASRAQYRSGIGYPMLAAPFIRLGFHGDPFAPVDVLAFGATLALTFLLSTHVRRDWPLAGRVLLGLAAAGVVAFSSPSLQLDNIPWNSTIVTPLGLLVLTIAVARSEITVWRALTLGIAVGWIFSTLYADALFLGLPVVALIATRTPTERRRILVWGGIALAVTAAPTLALQQYALGSWIHTPYQFHYRASTGGDAQYRAARIPTHFMSTFITGRLGGQRVAQDPLLRQFPLLALAPIGAFLMLRARSKLRPVWLAALAGSAVGSLFYLSFIGGGAGDLGFGNLGYWLPWYPISAILAVVAIASIALYTVRTTHRIVASGDGAKVRRSG
jgi:hypothetical protein